MKHRASNAVIIAAALSLLLAAPLLSTLPFFNIAAAQPLSQPAESENSPSASQPTRSRYTISVTKDGFVMDNQLFATEDALKEAIRATHPDPNSVVLVATLETFPGKKAKQAANAAHMCGIKSVTCYKPETGIAIILPATQSVEKTITSQPDKKDAETFVKSQMELQKKRLAVLQTVQDEKTAIAAIGKLKNIAQKNKVILKQYRSIPFPPEQEKQMEFQYAVQANQIKTAIIKEMGRIETIPKAFSIFGDSAVPVSGRVRFSSVGAATQPAGKQTSEVDINTYFRATGYTDSLNDAWRKLVAKSKQPDGAKYANLLNSGKNHNSAVMALYNAGLVRTKPFKIKNVILYTRGMGEKLVFLASDLQGQPLRLPPGYKNPPDIPASQPTSRPAKARDIFRIEVNQDHFVLDGKQYATIEALKKAILANQPAPNATAVIFPKGEVKWKRITDVFNTAVQCKIKNVVFGKSSP